MIIQKDQNHLMKVIFKKKKKIIPCLFSCIFIPFSLFHFTKVEDKVSFSATKCYAYA